MRRRKNWLGRFRRDRTEGKVIEGWEGRVFVFFRGTKDGHKAPKEGFLIPRLRFNTNYLSFTFYFFAIIWSRVGIIDVNLRVWSGWTEWLGSGLIMVGVWSERDERCFWGVRVQESECILEVGGRVVNWSLEVQSRKRRKWIWSCIANENSAAVQESLGGEDFV